MNHLQCQIRMVTFHFFFFFFFFKFLQTYLKQETVTSPKVRSQTSLTVLFPPVRKKGTTPQLPPSGFNKQALCSFVFGFIKSRNVVLGLPSRLMLLHRATSLHSQYLKKTDRPLSGNQPNQSLACISFPSLCSPFFLSGFEECHH